MVTTEKIERVLNRFEPKEDVLMAKVELAMIKESHKKLYSSLQELYNAIDSCVDLTPELLIRCNEALKNGIEL